jgi:hypothetical protein
LNSVFEARLLGLSLTNAEPFSEFTDKSVFPPWMARSNRLLPVLLTPSAFWFRLRIEHLISGARNVFRFDCFVNDDVACFRYLHFHFPLRYKTYFLIQNHRRRARRNIAGNGREIELGLSFWYPIATEGGATFPDKTFMTKKFSIILSEQRHHIQMAQP